MFVSGISDSVKSLVTSFNVLGIKILKAGFQSKLYCIVIPSHYPFKQYENELFRLYRSELQGSGFWGQMGMGYKGKEWEVVN